MEADIEKTSTDIVNAINLIMDPTTPVADRKTAHEMLETFKDTSTLCAKCGVFLSAKQNPPIIRHCGYQLIDNYIKLRWNQITVNEKVWIKDSVLQRIATGTAPVLEEEPYVKDALSRIIVELIKREWPQQWPTLMDELSHLCSLGDEQTELILLVFSRLADDIVQFQNVHDSRRREIYRTLCSHLDELFIFFKNTLSNKSEQYIKNKSMGIADELARRNCRMTQVTLETVSTFVEWVPISCITSNRPLLKLMCKLLEYEDLRLHAAVTLLALLERKGKPDERKDLLFFFEDTTLFMAINHVDVYAEQNYLFLKVLLQCFLSLGLNLSSSITQLKGGEPESFCPYMKHTLNFIKHPSLVLSQITQTIWLNVLRSPQLSSSESVTVLIPTFLKYVAAKLLKCGYTTGNDTLTSKFFLIDFDSQEEFDASFSRFRVDVVDSVKRITKMNPRLTFSHCSTLLKSLICGQDWSEALELTSRTDLAICWEAMVAYIDGVCSTLLKNIETPDVKELVPEGVCLLEICIAFVSEDPVILSFSLSCISSLFFFAEHHPDLRLRMFEKIFSNLTSFKKDNPHVRDVKNLKRHSSSLLIKLSVNHPMILLPHFDFLCQRVQELMQSRDFLTQFDKCALMESLMILSNKFCNFQKQSDFLKAAMASIDHIWASPAIILAIESPESFVCFMGLNKSWHEMTDDSTISKDACDLLLAVNVVRACVKRCVLPSDAEVAKAGNFIHPLSSPACRPFYRNPAAQFIIPILYKVIQITRILNELHDPLQSSKFHPSFLNVLEISDTDKNNILGSSFMDPNQQPRNASVRMKLYLHNLYDACLHILGAAIENLGIDFYLIEGLPSIVKGSILHKMECMPSMNLRTVVRIFLRPLFLWSPPTSHNELMEVLASLCPFMLQKLSSAWEKFKLRYGTSTNYEEQQTEMQEILDDQLNRLLTREYISFLGELLHKQNTTSSSEDAMENDHMDSWSPQAKTLTELGQKIIQTESVRAVYICTAFDALHWLDSTANIKALYVSSSLFTKITEDGLVRQIEEANYLLQSVLYGLQELGQHDANLGVLLSFGVTVYETLRVKFPGIRSTLVSSVCSNEPSIKKLDDCVNKCSPKLRTDKQKKEAFKAVVANIIGKNVGQQHKKGFTIKNLSPLICLKPKADSSMIDVTINDDIGLCSLFAPTDQK